MLMDFVANSHNDEFYTPAYAVKPILKYLKPNSKIWCPFDTNESYFVSELIRGGHSVVNTHISKGQNFFTEVVPDVDYIISNPPYTLKTEVLARLFEIGKPFAMLVGTAGLFESQRRFEMFRDNEFEILYFNRRVAYFKSYADQKPSANPPFSSAYVCRGVLPKTIMFEEIDKSNQVRWKL